MDSQPQLREHVRPPPCTAAACRVRRWAYALGALMGAATTPRRVRAHCAILLTDTVLPAARCAFPLTRVHRALRNAIADTSYLFARWRASLPPQRRHCCWLSRSMVHSACRHRCCARRARTVRAKCNSGGSLHSRRFVRSRFAFITARR